MRTWFFEKSLARSRRFTDDQQRRLAAKAKVLAQSVLRKVGTLVTPDTLLRWHHRLIARKYGGSGHRRPGRPGVIQEIRAAVVQMATENKDWGYDRFEGVLSILGIGSVIRRLAGF